MARLPRDTRLETRDARLALPARREPYWRQLVAGTALGYRRSQKGGAWVRRQRISGRYVESRLGAADDFAPADGAVVLAYSQAVKQALAESSDEHFGRPRHFGDGSTVDAALDAYLLARAMNNPSSTANSADKQRAANWIRPCFGRRLINSLTTTELRDWLATISTASPFRRAYGSRGLSKISVDLSDESVQRKRRITANRTFSVLRAALNAAWRDERSLVTTDLAWRRVKPLRIRHGDTPRMLTSDEISRLLTACTSDLRHLVEAALLTGARYGELNRLQVSDFTPAQGVVRIRQFKTGKTLMQPLTPEGIRFFTARCAGRQPADLILTHAGGNAWMRSHQCRPMLDAYKRAGIGKASFKTLRATYGKLLLQATLDLELVAKALGHSDSRTTRLHYAQYLPDEVTLAVQKMPRLGIFEAA